MESYETELQAPNDIDSALRWAAKALEHGADWVVIKPIGDVGEIARRCLAARGFCLTDEREFVTAPLRLPPPRLVAVSGELPSEEGEVIRETPAPTSDDDYRTLFLLAFGVLAECAALTDKARRFLELNAPGALRRLEGRVITREECDAQLVKRKHKEDGAALALYEMCLADARANAAATWPFLASRWMAMPDDPALWSADAFEPWVYCATVHRWCRVPDNRELGYVERLMRRTAAATELRIDRCAAMTVASVRGEIAHGEPYKFDARLMSALGVSDDEKALVLLYAAYRQLPVLDGDRSDEQPCNRLSHVRGRGGEHGLVHTTCGTIDVFRDDNEWYHMASAVLFCKCMPKCLEINVHALAPTSALAFYLGCDK